MATNKRACAALVPGLLLGLASLPALFFADQARAPRVTVEYVSPNIVLRVTKPTALRTVLEAICQGTGTRCELAPGVAQDEVAPITQSGLWSQVVAKLLEGSRLNYVVISPRPGGPGQLLVEQRETTTAQGEETGKGPGPAGMTGSGEQILSPAGSPLISSDTDETPKMSHPEDSTPVPQGSGGAQGLATGAPLGLGSPADQPGQGLGADPEQTAKSNASFRMFYEGLSGMNRPPGPPPTTMVLPFPDPNGNPITVPVTNEPLTVLPWPGPDGQPIVVKPAPPGTKVEYPIPPNYPTVR